MRIILAHSVAPSLNSIAEDLQPKDPYGHNCGVCMTLPQLDGQDVTAQVVLAGSV